MRSAAGRLRAAAVLAPATVSLSLGLWGVRRGTSMWRDESVTYQVAHRELADLWRLLGGIDAVHGLYYLLLHAVFGAWEGGLLALRLPSVLATALAAAGVASIALRLAGPRAAALSGVAFAVLPMVQHYAQEGRSYALVCAAVVWGSRLLLHALDRGGAAPWAGYAATLLVACWLHQFAALALLAHGVTLLRVRPPAAARRGWTAAAAAVVAGTLPLVVLGAAQAERQLGWLGPPGAGDWLLLAALAAVGWACARALRSPNATAPARPLPAPDTTAPARPLPAPGDAPPGPAGRPGPALPSAPGAPAAPPEPRAPSTSSPPEPGPPAASRTAPRTGAGRPVTVAALALPLLLLPPVLLMTVSLLRPWYVDRYVLYSTAGLALLCGASLDRALGPAGPGRPLPGSGRRPARIALVCAGVAALISVLLPWSLALRSPESRKDDAVAVAEAVRASAAPGDAVLFLPSRRREWLLSFPRLRARLDDLALEREPAASATLQGTELPPAEIRRRMLATDRIIALTDPVGQPRDPDAGEAVKRETLKSHFRVCRVEELPGARLVVHVRSGARCTSVR
ncbi:glycosyltransferase family 39 protein [Streptomyces zingiberis]|uniref:Glycosyltransferase RgtA/B/C/D-like domain-containing protein n=1 Tax=Streptomyces zingiberis TaxID=2053010 RepID=A0ABX1BSG6_9ACTN|nr:hypothetical protein [Streptomyces zingiberis]NJQ00008.1 hypothetical protein [Streptomyces zingiberis]